MLGNRFTQFKDMLHAYFCYQLLITPIHLPIEKEYRNFARHACDFFVKYRTNIIDYALPRHHVIHHFAAQNTSAKKILITHGWMSRSAYMIRLIYALHQHGYDVYALDFPAHGEAKGIQLPWLDAVSILQEVINKLGPFYAVVGHSFGGTMLLNMLTLASQFSEWRIHESPERVVLMASPTRIRTPVGRLARRFKLSGQGLIHLRNICRQQAMIDIKDLDFRHYVSSAQTPFLCVHGEKDDSIKPYESAIFCQTYPHASLALLPNADHVSVLIDERVEKKVCQFLV